MKMKKFWFWLLSIFTALAMVSCGDRDKGGDDGDDGNDGGYENYYYEEGMYLGIIGFNSDLYTYPMGLLNDYSQTSYNNFITNLDAVDLTALYYAVDNAVTLLKKTRFPEDIINASIITFTDGLDNQSLAFTEKYDDEDKYGDYVHNRIQKSKIKARESDLPVSAYSIGLKSTGAADVSRFESTLKRLASSEDNWFEVDNMDEVNKKFKEIAQNIYETSTTQSLTVSIPGGIGKGKRIRFTLDIPRVDGNMPSEKAEQSKLYIEGIHYSDGNNRYLKDIKCNGLSFSGGTELQGEFNISTKKYDFVFKDIVLDDEKATLDKSKVGMWRDDPWVYEDEFRPDDHTNIEETKRTAAIVLVLDCTTSLGDLFSEMKVNAKNFINILVKGVNDNSGGNNGGNGGNGSGDGNGGNGGGTPGSNPEQGNSSMTVQFGGETWTPEDYIATLWDGSIFVLGGISGYESDGDRAYPWFRIQASDIVSGRQYNGRATEDNPQWMEDNLQVVNYYEDGYYVSTDSTYYFGDWQAYNINFYISDIDWTNRTISYTLSGYLYSLDEWVKGVSLYDCSQRYFEVKADNIPFTKEYSSKSGKSGTKFVRKKAGMLAR